MSGVFFASDLHLGHKNIIKFMEFETVEHHDEFVFNKIMEVGGKRSSLYLLGDTCFHKDSFHYIEKIKEEFNKVTMIIGNHDFERSDSPSIKDYLELDISLYALDKYLMETTREKDISCHINIDTGDLRCGVNFYIEVKER